jgi:hypothetical protein
VVEATIGGSNYSTISTDVPVGTGDHYRPFGDTLGDVDTNLDKVLDVETVRPLIAALPERQRTVLTLRFFENLTQTQIAERIGCSQMHVSRLLAKALGTLRSHVRGPDTRGHRISNAITRWDVRCALVRRRYVRDEVTVRAQTGERQSTAAMRE